MGFIKYCLMCLETEVKMYEMNSSMLTIYNELILTRHKLSMKLMHACYECAYLLHKYEEFKSKCCRAYNILCNLNPGSFEITEENLRIIDRKQNKLESLLTVCTSTTHYQTEQYLSVMQMDAQKIKREQSVKGLEEQCNEKKTRKKIVLPNIVTNAPYHNDQLEHLDIYSEFISSIKSASQCDVEYECFAVDMLETERFQRNSNEDCAIDGLTVESTSNDITGNKIDMGSSINLNIECLRSSHDSVILDRYPEKIITVNNKDSVLDIRKRKCIRQADNIMHSNEIIKNNNTNNNLIDSHNLVSDKDEDVKLKEKKKTKLNSTSNVPIKNKEDHRLTLDSSFFKDHMTIIKLTPEDAKCELLLRKESSNYKMNLHKCHLCYRGFILKATYESHMEKHSLEYGKIKCDICQLCFSKNRSLSRHWSMCHTWKLHCKTCPYMCFNINQAKSHIQSHKGKKYTCKDCEESFRFPNSLSTHIRLKHSIELVCEFCGSTFASTQGMGCHKSLRHRKEKNEHLGPQCEECNVHFASELAWKRHRVLCSRHDVQNGCVVCGETFSSRMELRSHSREHGEPTTTAHSRSRKMMDCMPMPCELCKKELHSRKAYVKHMNTEHPQTDTDTNLSSRCVCEVCGQTFRHRSFLIAHQRKHTDEKPFSCPQCGKKFKNVYAVKMHLPMHTNEYTFKCHLCEKAFGDRGKLNRHVKGHLGIRPYKCSYCDRTFMFQCEERLHTKYVHCKEPYPKRDRRKRNAVKKELNNCL